MLRHVLLGLLRDDRPRHGYGLLLEYQARCGQHINVGNIYRELARLAVLRLVRNGIEPSEEDVRRIPYRITEEGRRAFDHWLVSPLHHDNDLSLRIIFIDHIRDDALVALLQRWRDVLWTRGQTLSCARDDALRRLIARGSAESYDPRPALLSRRLKHVMADLEFLAELRTQLAPRHGNPASGVPKGTAEGSPQPTDPARRSLQVGDQ